jgi:hypothetical protein
MLSPPSASFRSHYQDLVSSGAIEPDAAQEEAADALAELEQRLSNYKPFRKQRVGRISRRRNPPHAQNHRRSPKSSSLVATSPPHSSGNNPRVHPDETRNAASRAPARPGHV